MVSLREPLTNGVTVEIVTSPTQHPRKEWLTFVVSAKARNRIRNWLNKQHRERAREIGMERLEKEAKRQHVSLGKIKHHPGLTEALSALHYADFDSFLAAIGTGRQGPETLLHRLFGEAEQPATLVQRVIEKLPLRRTPEGVRVRGSDDILVRFAKCCSPVHGDPIAGYVTQGQGVSVHHRDCANFAALATSQERVVEVEWDAKDETERPVPLVLFTADSRGLLAKISSVIAELGANIREASVATTGDGRGRMDFVVEVRNLRQLDRIIQQIRQVPGVESVIRK